MTLRRLATTLLLIGTALAVTAPQALAHTQLTVSDPPDGASLGTAPQQIKLTFAEAVTLPADPIQVTGPGGALWMVGKPTISGAVITAPVQPAGPPGQYTITYKVTADDGDTVNGAVHFTLTAPATQASASPGSVAPAAQVSGSDSNGVPVWVWILIGVVVLAVLVALLVLRWRRSSASRHN
jgi:methionine-rich copper-binding protein CopC